MIGAGVALVLAIGGPAFAASADDITNQEVAPSESTQQVQTITTSPSEAVTDTTVSTETQTSDEAELAPTKSSVEPVQVTVAPVDPATLPSQSVKELESTSTERAIGTVLWEITSPTDDVFLTPQKYVTEIATDNVNSWNNDSSLKCGTKYQADAYYVDQIPALKADRLLKGGEDNGIALHWNVFTTPACPVVVPPAAPNPHAFQLVTCGQDIVTVTNDLADAKERLTASFVVYDNGKFLDAMIALSGTPTVQAYTFPEDSGVHVITVRTGPAQGDVLLDSKTVLSDCKPAVVVPPVVTEPPVVTPPVVDTPVTPITPPKAVLVADKQTEGLAYTGSDPLQLLFGGGVLFILGIIAFGVARKRSRA